MTARRRQAFRRRGAIAISAVSATMPRWAIAIVGAAGLLLLTAASGVPFPWRNVETVWLQGWLIELLLPQIR